MNVLKSGTNLFGNFYLYNVYFYFFRLVSQNKETIGHILELGCYSTEIFVEKLNSMKREGRYLKLLG